MLYEDQLTGAPGGPQPPQPGSPAPSSPPGTPPPMPPMDLTQGAPAPVEDGAPATMEPAAPAQAGVQVADAADSLQQSMGPAGPDPNLDETIRRLQESLNPRAPAGPGNPVGGPDPNAPPMAAQPIGPDALARIDATAQEEKEAYIESQSSFGRAVMRLFGTDVDDPMPLTRMGTTITGMVGGGSVGSQIPGGPIAKGVGTVVGGTVGTVLGAMAPENTIDILEMTGFLEPGSRDRLGLNDHDLKTLLLGEAVLDLYTMGGVTAARAVGRGATNIMTGANAASKGLAEAASREGVALLPVQVGEGRFARGYVSVMGRMPLVATGLKRRSVEAMDQIGRMFEGVPARLGPVSSMDEVSGRILRDMNYTTEGVARHFDRESTRILGLADANGIVVRPTATRTATDILAAQLEREIPQGERGPLAVTQGSRDLRNFLNRTTRLLTDIDPATGRSGTAIADLPLRQMDTMLQTIDEQMAKFAARGDGKSLGRLEMLRNAVQADSLTGMVRDPTRPGRLTTSPASQQIMNQFRAMDEDFTYTVNEVLGSATARRMGVQTSVTGRAMTMTDMGTRGTDKLAEVLLRDGTPGAINEIGRFAGQETMQRLSSAVMNKALDDAYIETSQAGARRFDINAFQKSLGLDTPGSSKYLQTQAMLQASGGLTMPELRTMVEFTARASATEIPNVGAFLARKMSFGGIEQVTRALPGLSTIGAPAAAGGAAAGWGGGLIAGITTIGGLRLISNMISNPQSARALRMVMNEEASAVVRKTAYIRGTTYAVHNMVKQGYIDAQQADNLSYNLQLYAGALDKELKRNAP